MGNSLARFVLHFSAEAERPENAQELGDNVQRNYSRIPRVKPRLKKGDAVRILLSPTNFAKGYDDLWSEEIYKVTELYTHMPRPMYQVSTLANPPEVVEGRWYESELQEIQMPSHFKVEKILKTKKVRGKTYYLIKWLGYDNSHNSWEEAGNVVDVAKRM